MIAAPLALRIDGGPPTVVGTAPSLGDGAPAAGTTALDVVFSEPVLGGGTAARYQLQSAGPDRLPGTLDDAPVPLSVAYAGSTAALRFPALTAGPYRLIVRDLLTDNAGNQLDGAGNGAGGGDWVRDFRVPGLIVTSLTPTPSGFVARFSGEFQVDGLNLYDGAGGALGAADVVLQDGAGQAVAGSLVVDLADDPALLEITAAALASGLPGNWSVENPPDTGTPGVAKIRASGTTPLAGTDLDGSLLIRPADRVPAGAARQRIWRDVDAKAELLESVLADLVHEIASAWRRPCTGAEHG